MTLKPQLHYVYTICQNQQERIGDKQIAGKADAQITEAAIQQELNSGNEG